MKQLKEIYNGSVLVSESALHDKAVMNAIKSLAKDNFEFKTFHGDSFTFEDLINF